MGWRVIDVWECELRGDAREPRLERLAREIAEGTDVDDNARDDENQP